MGELNLLDLPGLIGGLIFAGGAVVLVFVPYFILRRALHPRSGDDTETIAGSILFRIGALHGLILALVFADELARNQNVRDIVSYEAAAIADLLRNLERVERTAAIEESVTAYLHSVIFDEWPNMGNRKLSAQTWLQWDAMYSNVLDLTPSNLSEESLREHLLNDVVAISEYRERRLFSASYGLSLPFWAIAIAGFVLISVPYFVFRPGLVNLCLLTTFGVYNGMVIYLILALSNPYKGPANIEPTPFLIVYESLSQ